MGRPFSVPTSVRFRATTDHFRAHKRPARYFPTPPTRISQSVQSGWDRARTKPSPSGCRALRVAVWCWLLLVDPRVFRAPRPGRGAGLLGVPMARPRAARAAARPRFLRRSPHRWRWCFALHEAFRGCVAGVSEPHVVQFPPIGGTPSLVLAGVAPTVQTTSANTSDNKLLPARSSALRAQQCLSWRTTRR